MFHSFADDASQTLLFTSHKIPQNMGLKSDLTVQYGDLASSNIMGDKVDDFSLYARKS